MAVSHVGTTFISGTSGTLPTHQAGDLLLISAFSSSATTPTLPADWTNIASLATPGFRAGYRFAPSAGTASGTWTNAGNGLVVSVYRGVSAVGAVASNKGNSATLTVSGITLEDNGGTSWVVAHMRGYQRMNSVPSGMTMRFGDGSGDYWDQAADTAAGVTSFSSRTVAHDLSARWATLTVELKGYLATTSGVVEAGLAVSGTPSKATSAGSPVTLDMSIGGSAVRSEGEIKPTAGAMNFPALDIDGVISDKDVPLSSGFPLGISTDGQTSKAGNIAGDLPVSWGVVGPVNKSVVRNGALPVSFGISGAATRKDANLGGLITRLVAYEPNGDRLGPLPGAQDWSVTIPYGGDNGAIDLNYSKAAPRYSVLMDPVEIALEVFDGQNFTEPWDCRWLALNTDYDESVPDGEAKISGVSMGFRMTKTHVADGPTDGDKPGERRFNSSTAGRVLTMLCAEAKARGALAGIDVSTFNADTDSAGQAWSLVHPMVFDIGLPMSAVLDDMIALGMIEMRWDKRTLLVFDAESSSRDQTQAASPVAFQYGRDLRSAPVTASIADVASVAIVRGDGGISVEVANPAVAASPWGRWETVLDSGGTEDEADLEALGEMLLEKHGVGRSQHTHALNFVGTKDLPFRDYRPGDWAWSIAKDSSTRAKYRIRQITLSRGTDGLVDGSVVLNDYLLESDVKLKRRMDSMQGGATNNAPRPRPVQTDNTTPNAPTGLAATTSVYLDGTRTQAQVSLTWVNPTTNTDGSPLTDLNLVQVWAKPDRPGTSWRFLTAAQAGETSVTYSPLEPSQTYFFRLTAIDFTGHTSVDSNTVSIDLANDLAAPPTPAAPSTDARNGIIEISFSGKTNAGADMPLDFSHVEVYASTSSTVAINAGNRVGTIADGASALTLASWPYNANLYAKVVAVDVVGNKSAPSPVSAPVTNSPVGSGDIGNDAVGPSELNVGGIDSAGDINVGNLNGKTITGVTIRTTGSGARVEMGTLSSAVDRIKFYANGGSAQVIFNMNDGLYVAGLLISAEGANKVIGEPSGSGLLKFIPSGLQVRTAGDGGYAPIQASAFTVSSEVRFKNPLGRPKFDVRAALKKARSQVWKWKWDEDDDQPPQVGLFADELPDEVRTEDGYSVTAVVALLWDALRDAHDRIDALESKPTRDRSE